VEAEQTYEVSIRLDATVEHDPLCGFVRRHRRPDPCSIVRGDGRPATTELRECIA
jgi:hypothetical protein